MIVTKAWIKSHGTRGRGFTRKQIEALGISYPPSSGWQSSVVGKVLTKAQVEAFTGGNKPKKKTPVERAQSAFLRLTQEEKQEFKYWLGGEK